jgi:hypothetical protein
MVFAYYLGRTKKTADRPDGGSMKRHFKTAGLLAVITLSVIALGACFPGQSIAGTWSGVVTTGDLCEGGVQYTIELTFTDDEVTVSGGTITNFDITDGASGTYSASDAGRFVLSINDGGELEGIVLVDENAEKAVIILDSEPGTGSNNGFVGVLQLAPLQAFSVVENDMVGTWSGQGVTVNSSYEVTSVVDTEMTVTVSDPLALNGTFGSDSMNGSPFLADGSVGSYEDFGASIASVSYSGGYVMSYDEQWLAAAFITNACDVSRFDDLPNHRFALYERQP